MIGPFANSAASTSPPAAANGAHDPTHTVLALLALRLDGDCLTLDFSGGASLRLTLEVVDVTLEDLSAPWLARSQPRHDGETLA